MTKIFTIGYTKKSCEQFFTILQNNKIDVLVDIRLDNNSYMTSLYTRYDCLEYILKLLNIQYFNDKSFAPTREIRDLYKIHKDWHEYEMMFEIEMSKRRIERYIDEHYHHLKDKNVCLLCSEPTADCCHRSIVARHFSRVFSDSEIINL